MEEVSISFTFTTRDFRLEITSREFKTRLRRKARMRRTRHANLAKPLRLLLCNTVLPCIFPSSDMIYCPGPDYYLRCGFVGNS